MYKNFNKTLKTIILITLSNCRIIANPNECLTLCCPCLFEKKVENEIENKVKNEFENKVKNEFTNKVKSEFENKSADEIEIENFFKTYNLNKNYKKDKNKSGNSLLEPTLENYINAFKDIDKRLGSFFKNNEYVSDEEYINNNYCIFYFLKKKEIKDILQVWDYCVTFNTQKNSHWEQDLVEALSIKEDDEIKYYSEEIKKLKENKMEVGAEDVTFFLGSDLYIYSNKDNKYIGGILFQPLNYGEDPLTFNIAYWLNYNYRGLGIMSVIIPTICKYFFTRIKKIKVYSFSWDKENSKSAGLAKKTCNFIRTGHEKEYEIEEYEIKKYEIEEEDNEKKEYICITKK